MPHHLLLASIKGPDIDDAAIIAQVEALLAPHRRGATVAPYVRREGSTLPPIFSGHVHFKEGAHYYLEQVANPLPYFDSYELPGKFAGCLHTNGSAERVDPAKLLSPSYNTVRASKFSKKFCPQILLTADGRWFTSPNSVFGIVGGDKHQERLFREIDDAPDSLLVVVDLNVEATTKTASPLFLDRR